MGKNVELFFVRHAESYGNVDVPDAQGHPDDPMLTPMGLQQAQRLAARLKNVPFSAIYASALVRACQTAEPLAAAREQEIHVLRELMEVGTQPANTPPSRAAALAPHSAADMLRIAKTEVLYPTADNTPSVCEKRAAYSMRRILSESNDGDSILICSHGGFMGYLLRYSLGLSLPETFHWQIDNCSLFRIKLFSDRTPKLVCANDVSHLL